MACTETSQFTCRIKLLSSNLVLVESTNYESEIFSPQIVDGRLTFLNIIPNRRCCQISRRNVVNFAKRELNKSSKSSTERSLRKSGNFDMFSTNDNIGVSSPLANSTPTGVKQKHSCGSQLYSRVSSTNSTLPSPEAVRRAAPSRSIFLENSLSKPPRVYKASRIYYNRMEGTPIKLGSLVMQSISIRSSHDSGQASLLGSSFQLSCSPILPIHAANENRPKNALHSTPTDCIAQWEKVLTPVRTYSRKCQNSLTVARLKSVNGLENQKATSKLTPTYLHNPTQCPNTSQHAEIKRCKLIRDSKTSISPRSFKKQQNESVDPYTIKSNCTLHSQSLSFHKPRPYLETMGMSAFDLLTNSNRNYRMARKLRDQFRKGCVNKASSTYERYKILSIGPAIQHDEQVLELSHISLEGSQAITEFGEQLQKEVTYV